MIFQTTQRYLFTTLTVFFLSVLFAGIAPAKEPDSQDIHHAKAFIQSMGDEVIDYISDPALSAKERKKSSMLFCAVISIRIRSAALHSARIGAH